jgi:hypothetical protein
MRVRSLMVCNRALHKDRALEDDAGGGGAVGEKRPSDIRHWVTWALLVSFYRFDSVSSPEHFRQTLKDDP